MTQVANVLKPIVKDLGDGFTVRRAIPQVGKKMVGPFVFWDHFGPLELKEGNEMAVRSHPHIGISTVTYLFSGKILHRDSLGNELAIEPGEVNWMTAGRGIVHSERTEYPGLKLEGIQLWIALPKDEEDCDPSFQHCKANELPEFKIDGTTFRLIVGSFAGHTSPVKTQSDMFYLTTELKSGNKVKLSVEEKRETAIYVVSGELEVEGKTYGTSDLVCFNLGANCEIKANEDCTLMVFGGEPYPEERYIDWNFVATSKEKIADAKERWDDRQFPPVVNEDINIYIPLPA